MLDRLVKKRKARQIAAIVGAVLVVALGVCFVADAVCGMDGHGMSRDVCAGTAMLLSVAILMAAPLPSGRFLPVSVRLVSAVPINLIDPPPKASLVS
jgi:hypothetical protein